MNFGYYVISCNVIKELKEHFVSETEPSVHLQLVLYCLVLHIVSRLILCSWPKGYEYLT